MESRQRTFSHNGFTLLECVVAVAIIAISFTTLLSSQSQSVSIATQTRFAVTSALLGQQKLTEIEATDFEQVSSSEGDFGEKYPGYRWKTEVDDVSEDESGIKGSQGMLKVVNLTVSLGDNDASTTVLSTVIVKAEAGK